MTTLQNLPNNTYKTKHGKFHLLIYTQRMHSISISTTEIPLLKGDRHSQSSVSSLFSTSIHSLSSLISRCDAFARYCTKESLTQFSHHGHTTKKKQWGDTQWEKNRRWRNGTERRKIQKEIFSHGKKGHWYLNDYLGLNSPSNIERQFKCFQKYNILVKQKERRKNKRIYISLRQRQWFILLFILYSP